MVYKYIVVRNTYLNDNDAKTRFGIAVVEEHDGNTEVLESVSDLSPNIERVKRLTESCNHLELDSVHLPDVVEDFLTII